MDQDEGVILGRFAWEMRGARFEVVNFVSVDLGVLAEDVLLAEVVADGEVADPEGVEVED